MDTTTQSAITSEDYASAVNAQSACNLSGIVGAWARITPRIWAEARAHGHGTEWDNAHPINVLFSEQAAQKTGATHGHPKYSEAYDYCISRQ